MEIVYSGELMLPNRVQRRVDGPRVVFNIEPLFDDDSYTAGGYKEMSSVSAVTNSSHVYEPKNARGGGEWRGLRR